MMRNYNQTKKYNVIFRKGDFKPQDWEFRMGEHPTKYGNGSSVAVFKNGEFRWMVDTRYDHDIMNDFGAWCMWYLEEYFDPKYEPMIVAM